MDATTLFIIGIVSAGALALLGVLTIAYRRGPESEPMTGTFDQRAVARDRARVAEQAAAGTSAVSVISVTEDDVDEAEIEPPVDPLLEREKVTETEMGVTRRSFFNRALLAIFGIYLVQFTIASLAFAWPKLKSGFGAPIDVGNIDELRSEIIQPDGSIVPLFVAAAQSWLVPMPEGDVPGSSFEGLPVLAGEGAGEPGLMALWQRCVHLGCRVPSCVPSQGFECPCHGSRYNFHGEYEAGPAPRNMDRFAVEESERGNLIVQTGSVIQTARAKNLTIAYPQGPSCV